MIKSWKLQKVVPVSQKMTRSYHNCLILHAKVEDWWYWDVPNCFEIDFVPVKTVQNHLKLQLSDVQKTEVFFKKLETCKTFNGASLWTAQYEDPNVVH